VISLDVNVRSDSMMAALAANPRQLAYMLAQLPKHLGPHEQQEVFKFLSLESAISPDTAAFWSHVAETMMERHL